MLTELYYYATREGLAALWSNLLKVASPCDFNDPFEFLPAFSKVTEAKRLFSIAFQLASKGEFYVLSLSARKNNARMWAQYGGNHSGLMFTLDFKQPPLKDLRECGALRKVDYDKPERLVIDPKEYSGGDIQELLSRKGEDWEHEEEWRVVMPAIPSRRSTNKPEDNRLRLKAVLRLTGCLWRCRMCLL